MDRRTFTLGMIPLWCVVGCKASLRSYDNPPDREMLDDHWPGHYFNRIHASYFLERINANPSLFRPASKPADVVSSDGRVTSSIQPVPTIRPKHAEVELTYDVDHAAAMREVEVTIHWPKANRGAGNSSPTFSETRTAPVGFDEIQEFLEGTGRFRVDPAEHFYGERAASAPERSSEYAIDVKLKIESTNPDGRFSANVNYRDGLLLYKLAERAWPGIG